MANIKVLPKQVRGFTQGVDVGEAAAAFGGLSATTILPGLLVRDSSTTVGKFLKISAGILSAGLAGMVGKSLSPKMGRAAVIGGMAGVFAQTIAMFGIGGGLGRMKQIAGPIRSAELVSSPVSRQDETVSLIQP